MYSPIMPSMRKTKSKKYQQSAHQGRPAYGNGGVKKLSDQHHQSAQKAGGRKQGAHKGSHPQRDHRKIQTGHKKLQAFFEGIIGASALPGIMFDLNIGDVVSGPEKQHLEEYIVAIVLYPPRPAHICGSTKSCSSECPWAGPKAATTENGSPNRLYFL